MGDERQDFSRRLAKAMRAAGYAPRPSVLLARFNSHYSGRSITLQTASRWLRGKAIPAQDKLQVLARLYGVEPHVLRFGEPATRTRVADARLPWVEAGPRERAIIDAFLALPPRRRELVGELIAAMTPSGE